MEKHHDIENDLVVPVLFGGSYAQSFYFAMPKYQYTLDQYMETLKEGPLQRIKCVLDIM